MGVEQYWLPKMYANVKDWAIMCDKCENRAQLRYDEPWRTVTVSRLWQRVGMHFAYMPKMEDGYHLVVEAIQNLKVSRDANKCYID